METFSALLAICAENSPVPGEFPAQRPVTRSFDVYFDLRPKERLSKQWWGWWFETLSRSLWRHRNVKKSILPNVCLPLYNPWYDPVVAYTSSFVIINTVTTYTRAIEGDQTLLNKKTFCDEMYSRSGCTFSVIHYALYQMDSPSLV